MTPIFIDIETIPVQSARLIDEIAAKVKPPGQMKKAETIAKWEAEDKPAAVADALRATSFDGAYGEIILIGLALGTEPIEVLQRPSPNDEAGLLELAFAWLRDHVQVGQRRNTQVVGHFVVDFDLRFMWQRAVIHGVQPPDWMPWLVKPWDERVFDTMVQWSGVKGTISLDKLCSVLGVARKGSEIGEPMDGSKVWDFWKAGRIEELVTYCAADVSRVRELYARMRFLPTAYSA
jgi:hypothetical protein